MAPGQLYPILHYLKQFREATNSGGDRELLECFVRHGDERAFVELLRRHGPMVLGVCRRILRHAQDAEDAFQTTFLVLCRKADGLRRPEGLGPWLHGVAYRTAMKARSLRGRSASAADIEDVPASESDDLEWRDLRPMLDQAIQSLPAKYRTPFVLCYLEGMTNAQAAAELGCPPGTVATRLSRARAWLRIRLSRRGLELPAGFLAAGLGSLGARAAVPPALIEAVCRAALGLSISAPVAALLKGVWTKMWMEKVRFWLLSVAVLAAVGVTVSAWSFKSAAAEEPVKLPAAPPAVEPVRAEPPPEAAPMQTPNFRVEAPTSRVARLIAEAAERHRKELAILWLGKELPAWRKPCPIRVTLTPSGSAGATSFAFDDGKVRDQAMILEGSLDHLLSNSLPHEITHTILAHHYGQQVPRWADEGAALLAEDQEEQGRHAKFQAQYLATPGRLIPLRRLVQLTSYPKDVMTLYVQGYSLTCFLIERKDRKTFVRFIDQAMLDGWDMAVKSHYGYEDLEKLEDAWLAHLKARMHREPQTSAAPGRRDMANQVLPVDRERLLPRGLAPTAGVAWIDDDRHGKLMVFHGTVSVYQPVTQRVRRGDVETNETSYELKQAEQVQSYQPNQIQAYAADGKRLSTETLKERLKKARPVLISATGQAVDPLYLQLLKEDTMILVLPQARPVLTTPPIDPAAPLATVPGAPPPAPQRQDDK